MWFFDFIPGTLFYLLFIVSVIGYLVSLLLPNILFKKQVKTTSIVVFILSIYLLGMLKVNNYWKAKTEILQQQLVELTIKSQETNTVIKDRLVTKTQIIKLRGDDIVKYVDKEITKYNNICEIPKEFIDAHNHAAESLK